MSEGRTEFFEGMGAGELNFGRVVLIHLSRIGNRGSEDLLNDSAAEQRFVNSVAILEKFIQPWLSDEYKGKRDEIAAAGGNSGTVDSVDEWLELLGLLMEELRDSPFLEIEEGTMRVIRKT